MIPKTIILSWFSAGAYNVVGKTNVPEDKLFIFMFLINYLHSLCIQTLIYVSFNIYSEEKQ